MTSLSGIMAGYIFWQALPVGNRQTEANISFKALLGLEKKVMSRRERKLVSQGQVLGQNWIILSKLAHSRCSINRECNMSRKMKGPKGKLSPQTVGTGEQCEREWVSIPLCFAVVKLGVRKMVERGNVSLTSDYSAPCCPPKLKMPHIHQATWLTTLLQSCQHYVHSTRG